MDRTTPTHVDDNVKNDNIEQAMQRLIAESETVLAEKGESIRPGESRVSALRRVREDSLAAVIEELQNAYADKHNRQRPIRS